SNNRCGSAASCFGFGGLGRKPAIFPAKFPVCRELVWRQVRSELRRQPGNLAFMDRSSGRQKRPQTAGLSCPGYRLHAPIFLFRGAELPKVSGSTREYSRSEETMAGDLVRSRLEGDRGTADAERSISFRISVGSPLHFSTHSVITPSFCEATSCA